MAQDLAHSDGALAPLSRGGPAGSSFQQTGSINWVDLASKTVSFTVGVLARLSAAGVDPYTVQVGLAIADRFAVSRDAEKRIERAILNLKAFGSFGKVLWFGFGVNSIARTLATTRQGAVCMSLCAALAECYTPNHAAEILYEVVKLCGAPSELVPSIAEWQALVVACQGALSASAFPLWADRMMNIRYPDLAPGSLSISPSEYRWPASPESLAECLWALGQVSRSEFESITIFGGANAGWLAAVAEWLLDLTVVIILKDGQVFHTNCPEGKEPQVCINLFWDNGSAPSNSLSISKVYRLQKWEDLILFGGGMDLGGRLNWETCLKATFGKDFETLLDMPADVGTIVGSSGRLFTAINNGEMSQSSSFERYSEHHWHYDSAHGKGFIESMIRYFPEMMPAKPHMEIAVYMSVNKALNAFQASMDKLSKTCNCMMCSERRTCIRNPLRTKFCLCGLTVTIIGLARSLAGMQIAENLLPQRVCLELLFEKYNATCKEYTKMGEKEAEISIIESFTPFPDLAMALSIFSNLGALNLVPRNLKVPEDETAMCGGGVCSYYDILQGISDDPELSGKIHVLPGNITQGGVQYKHVKDPPHEPTKPQSVPWLQRDWPKSMSPSEILAQYTEVTIAVKPKIDTLLVTICLTAKNGKVARIQPAELLHLIRLSHGQFLCRRHQCTVVDDNIKDDHDVGFEIENGTSTMRVQFFKGNALVRCLALVYPCSGTCLQGTILQCHECIQCCLQEGMRRKWGLLSIIRKPDGESHCCHAFQEQTESSPSPESNHKKRRFWSTAWKSLTTR